MADGLVSSPSPLIQLRAITKRFPGVTALDGVDLDLHGGTIHALLGENGAGKSTLINILGGLLAPDRGQVLHNGQSVHWADARSARAAGIALVHQEADLFGDLTVAENVALEHGWPLHHGAIDWAALRRRTHAALRELGQDFNPDQTAATLTAGKRQLLGIAAALAQDASVLVLDEPTSSLSGAETQVLFTHLRRFRARGGAILYVSHRLEEVFQLADTVTVLRDGRRVWTGPRTETDAAHLIGWMVGRTALAVPQRAAGAAGRVRLACRRLTAADGSFHDVSLEVRAGEVLGLYGLIGAGRSEWAQAVFGLRPLAGGEVLVDDNPLPVSGPGEAARRGLAYLPEDRLRLGLCSGLSVRANAVLAALRRLALGPFVAQNQETNQARALVEQLAVRLHSLNQPVRTLSGGNQQKVVLGRWLACDPGVLILDEPTRGVDIGAKAEIHTLLRGLADAGRAVVLISSDLPEVLAHSDRLGVFRGGRLVVTLDAPSATPEQVAAAALPAGPDTTGLEMGPRPDRTGMNSTWLREAGLLAVVAVLAAALALATDTFWQPATLRDVGARAALLVLCGLGAALVILAGGIDISFGAIMALSGATAGFLMQEGQSPLLAVPLGLAVGMTAGGLNAGLALVGRVHPIVITLGTLSLYRGLTLLLVGAKAIHEVPDSFRAPLQSAPLGLPALVWLAVVVVALTWGLLGWTVAGRQVYALGNNPEAARRAGIHKGRIWLAVFAVQGLLAGLAGLLALGMAGHLQGTDFAEMTLEAIGVAVVGGIAITGGRGSVWGIWGAALLFRLLEKGWALLHISGYWQRTIVGSLLLAAILSDRLWRRFGELKRTVKTPPARSASKG
jgi:ABC-type sugar transport system ATPase subunit/ribose/xylose/arabinose/galactoside ABC-type transport system permease subunit